MTDEPDEFFRLTAHECAHAFVACYFGFDAARIRIGGGLKGGGRTSFGTPQNPVAMLAIIMAGEVVEQLLFGRAENCTGDHDQLTECLEKMGWAANDARLALIRRMTKRIVKTNLSDITRAAKQLTVPGNYTVHWRPGAIQ